MANQIYPIYGKVFDGASNLLSGVTVNLRNAANGEQLATSNQYTTEANGEFSVNAADLTTSITDGQEYEVEFTKNGYETFKVVGTFVIVGGGDEVIIDLMKDGVKSHKFKQDYEFAKKKVDFKVWANNKLSTATATVIKTGGSGRGKGVNKKLVFAGVDLYPGQVAYITQMTQIVRTAAKFNALDIAKCSGESGTGTIAAVSPVIYQANGTLVENKPFTLKFVKPIRVEYNPSSAKSIGLRSNDGAGDAYVDVSMEGYILEE